MFNESLEETIEKNIHENIVKYVLEYLQTGIFRNKTTNSFMIAHKTVIDLADDEGDSSIYLYNYFIKTIRGYIIQAVNNLKTFEGELLIDEYLKENKKIKILIYWMRKIFNYLDKFFMKNTEKGSLYGNALNLYFETMFKPLKTQLFSTTILMIRDDRMNKLIIRSKIKEIIKIYEEVDLDDAELQKSGDDLIWVGKENFVISNEFIDQHLIPETQNFTLEKSNLDINSLSIPEYVTCSLKYLEDEDQRMLETINKIYLKKIEKVNIENFVISKTKELAKRETGITFMLKNKRSQELKDIFTLISKDMNSLKIITDELDPYIRGKGEELKANSSVSRDPKLLIPELIKLKGEIDELVEFAFSKNIMFQTCKKNAFSAFLNIPIFQKQIANYCDWEMRAGIKGNSDSQIERKMEDINNIFKCMLSKEIFIQEYSKRLGDRLLGNKSQSITQEKNLISRMKNEFGISNVSKITRKIEDLEASRTEMDIFRKENHRAKPNGVEVNIQVLDDSSWEIEKIKFEKFEGVNTKIEESLKIYNDFYVKRHSSHRLRWVYGNISVDIQIQKLNKPYLLTCNLIQLGVLQLLEKKGPLNIKIISDYLSFDTKQTLHEIQFLWASPSFNPKKLTNLGIVIPENHTNSKDLNDSVVVKINTSFQNASIKISSIPTSAPKKTQEELEKEEKDELMNRKKFHNQLIDATIVRIMKGRIGKKTTHGYLVTETSRQIDMFTAQPAQIKERIEHLMQDCFIKRCEDDKNCYEYIA